MYEDNCKGREGDDTKRCILLEITPVIGRIYFISISECIINKNL